MSLWKGGSAKIPKNVTTLNISCLNHQFSAMSIHRGVVAGSWETVFAAEAEPDFAGLIREAVQKTKYHGTTVSLLLASSKLAQKLVDVPPVAGTALVKILQREAQQQKLFTGEAAWTSQSVLTVKGVQRVILHLLPKTFLDQLVQACQQNGLHLASVVPVSAVLHQQLAQLPMNKGEVALLAAETGSCTTVVIGRADGQLLLVRTLMDNWYENAERLTLDLKRTISFIAQQFDLNIHAGVWVFGPAALQPSPALQRQLELPVTLSPVEYLPDYWTTAAAKLAPAITPNFIGLESQNAPRRRKFAWVVAASTALFVLASVAGAFILHRQAAQEAANTNILRKHVTQLQAQRQSLAQRNAELAGREQLVKEVLETPHPPVPAWILGYLSEALPAELVVTNLHVRRDDDAWNFFVAGTLQPTSNLAAPATLTNAVGRLAAQLANGPFQLTILHRSDRPEAQLEKTGATGNGAGRGKGNSPADGRYWIEGVIQ